VGQRPRSDELASRAAKSGSGWQHFLTGVRATTPSETPLGARVKWSKTCSGELGSEPFVAWSNRVFAQPEEEQRMPALLEGRPRSASKGILFGLTIIAHSLSCSSDNGESHPKQSEDFVEEGDGEDGFIQSGDTPDDVMKRIRDARADLIAKGAAVA